MEQPNWIAMATEFKQFGKNYQPNQLADPDWCVRELAMLGYAVQITYVTRAFAREKFGREPDYPVDVDGLYTYQLWGPRYPQLGAHPSVVTESISLATMMALYNICRLDFLHPVSEESKTKH